MQNVAIDNPVINTPFEEPKRHFYFADDGLGTDTRSGRRKSAYLVPIPGPRKRKAVQLSLLDGDTLQEQLEENTSINQLRERVAVWRQGGYVGITGITRRLLQHWTNPERERRLFFCQIEAVETAIYITEVASKHGHVYTENHLRAANNDANPELFRIAFKMATGSGKP
jgi:type III restriction enzyme